MITVNKDFVKKSLLIIIPVALQNLIFSGLSLVDTLMIGQLGEESIAGVSLGNQFFFVLTLFFFGVTGGTSIFTSQFFGAKQIERIRNVLGVGLKIVVIAGLVFTITGRFFPQYVLGIFTKDTHVIEIGAKYLKIVSICYLFSGISFLLSGVLRSVGIVNLPTIISAISLSLNTLINYLLIFGNHGFPPLGVEGAAIATVISRVFELTLILIVLLKKDSFLLKLKIKDFVLDRTIKKRYLKTLVPVITNETAWALGAAGYSAIYAHIGTDSIAAFQIQQTITTMFLIFIFGSGNASAILIGHKLGEGNTQEAYNYGKVYIIFSIILGIFTGLLITLVSPLFLPLFNVKEGVIITTKLLITIFSIVLVFKSLNITIIVGVLRGGGDTTVAMFLDILGVWLIGIPLGLLGAFVLKWPIELVYIFICVEEVAKGIYGIIRFRSKKWINILTEE
jgi:putative MATE family efflux protein